MDLANFSVSNLIAGFVFGVFGLYIFNAARREHNGKRLMLGLILMVYPYFVSNPWVNWLVGVVLLVLNYRWPWLND